jgi:hypothetical protein
MEKGAGLEFTKKTLAMRPDYRGVLEQRGGWNMEQNQMIDYIYIHIYILFSETGRMSFVEMIREFLRWARLRHSGSTGGTERSG